MSKAQFLLEKAFKVKKTRLPSKNISVPAIRGKPVKLQIVLTINDWTRELQSFGDWNPEEEDVISLEVAVNGETGEISYLESAITLDAVHYIHDKLVKAVVPIVKKHKELQNVYFDRMWFYIMGGSQFYAGGGSDYSKTDPIHGVAKDVARQVGGKYIGDDWKSPSVALPGSASFKQQQEFYAKKAEPSKKKSLARRAFDKFAKPKREF